MCGIAGYFGSQPPPPDRIADGLAALRHRGPDGEGRLALTAQGQTAVLLHTRLAIVDLDHRSDQPFRIGDKTLVYNGELYNFKELRAELEEVGRSFRTSSDTEVLLTAIDVWGMDALDRFEGMWAFALHDAADGSLTLCRDRFGQKPLYLLEDDRGLWFGSEAKALFRLRGSAPSVDRDHICRYLVNGYKSLYKAPGSFFQGMVELPPATVLKINSDGGRRQWRYWQPAFRPDETMTFARAVDETRERMIETVRLHLRGDVPIAFCMSGGVDSNSLIAIAKKVLGYDVHGFTIQLNDERYDERSAVENAVGALGLRHSTVSVSPSGALEGLTELVRQHDAPVYTISYYLHSRLMERMAAAGFKISISGTGADELFSGYYDHYLMHLQAVHGTSHHDEALADWNRYVRPVVRNPYLSDPDRFVRDPDFRDHIFLRNDDFRQALRVPFTEGFTETRYTDSLMRNRMMNEMFHEGVPVILHEDDLNAMHCSIENRSPYLSRSLFDFCYGIPDQLLIRDGYNKAILRAAMRGIVPDAIIDQRRKYGFNGPTTAFIDVNNAKTRDELLKDSPIFDLLHRQAIVDLFDRGDLMNSDSKFLFYFVNAKIFLEQWSS